MRSEGSSLISENNGRATQTEAHRLADKTPPGSVIASGACIHRDNPGTGESQLSPCKDAVLGSTNPVKGKLLALIRFCSNLMKESAKKTTNRREHARYLEAIVSAKRPEKGFWQSLRQAQDNA